MNWRSSTEYRLWRVAVIRRDKLCVVCGSRKKRQAHHINHATYYTKERFTVDNGITLCSKCHSQYHNNFHNSTREKCNTKDFNNFISLVVYLKGL